MSITFIIVNLKFKNVRYCYKYCDYFTKIYPKASEANLYAISEAFVEEHKKKVYLAKRFPDLKLSDIVELHIAIEFNSELTIIESNVQ